MIQKLLVLHYQYRRLTKRWSWHAFGTGLCFQVLCQALWADDLVLVSLSTTGGVLNLAAWWARAKADE